MKKIIRIGAIALLVGLIWLLFLKPNDYVAVVEAKTTAGVINQTLKTWSKALDSSEIRQGVDLNSLSQTVVFNDSAYAFEYDIHAVNDSLSEVRIGVNLEKNNWGLRLSISFQILILREDREIPS